MGLELIKPVPILNDLYFRLWLWDGKSKINRTQNYLNKDDKILDIGCGPASVSLLLTQKGYDVTPLDIKDLSFTDSIKPVVYDGNHIPFEDKEFDVSLLLTVLHHVHDPIKLISEAVRVSKKIILIEDVYDNPFQKYLTYFADSLINLEIIGHPHSNKSDRQWKYIFNEMGLMLSDSTIMRYIYFFRQATYVLNA